ncbi:MAG: hypothetical protein ACREAA_14820 [Candidatus Polarisedimenticolia bacterium]
MGRKVSILTMSLLSALAAGSVAAAQDARPRIVVDVTMLKEVVVRDGQGRQEVALEDASSTSPGDTLVLKIDYSNQGQVAAHNARVVDPIPAGTQLVPGSWTAAGAEMTVSIDGGKTYEVYPARRPVSQPDGKTVMKEVEASAYTHVRWTALEPLAPGDARSATFKVKVR